LSQIRSFANFTFAETKLSRAAASFGSERRSDSGNEFGYRDMSIAVAKICSKNAAKCRQNYASPPLHLEKSATEDEVVDGKRENGSAMQCRSE